MTHSDLLLCAAASSRVSLTFGDARDLVGAHEHLLEERDALREQLREMESDHDRAASVARTALARAEGVEKERDEARAALAKVNEIRNSIIGLQTVNWSEHVYPLVAALDGAGLPGLPYPEARGRFGTMLERTLAAESSLSRLRGQVRSLALEKAQVAGRNMTYEVKRESRLLDPRPTPWQAREIEYIYWPARASRDLWRILRARPTTAPGAEERDAS